MMIYVTVCRAVVLLRLFVHFCGVHRGNARWCGESRAPMISTTPVLHAWYCGKLDAYKSYIVREAA